jgi:hypothetical protein
MSNRTLAPSAARLNGRRFRSFADLGLSLAQASADAANDAREQNRLDVEAAKRLRRNRRRREQRAAAKVTANA